MTDIELLLNRSNPSFLADKIKDNLKKKRIKLNYTQKELSKRSGVALSNLKRFEQKAEISLVNLLKLAIVLDASKGFEILFEDSQPDTLNDFLKSQKNKERKRARKT